MYLSWAVEESVLQIPRDGFHTVFEGAFASTFIRPGEIGLEGTGATIGFRNIVRMVRPHCGSSCQKGICVNTI